MDAAPELATVRLAAAQETVAMGAFEDTKAAVITATEALAAAATALPGCRAASVGAVLATMPTLGPHTPLQSFDLQGCLTGVCAAAGVASSSGPLNPLRDEVMALGAAWEAVLDAQAAVATWAGLQTLGARVGDGWRLDPAAGLREVKALADATGAAMLRARLVVVVPGSPQAALRGAVMAAVADDLAAVASGWARGFPGLVQALCDSSFELALSLEQWVALVGAPGLPPGAAAEVTHVFDAAVGALAVPGTWATTAPRDVLAQVRALETVCAVTQDVPPNLVSHCHRALGAGVWGPPWRTHGPRAMMGLVAAAQAAASQGEDLGLRGLQEVVGLGVRAALAWAADPNPGDLGPALVALVHACARLEAGLQESTPRVVAAQAVPVMEACAVFLGATWVTGDPAPPWADAQLCASVGLGRAQARLEATVAAVATAAKEAAQEMAATKKAIKFHMALLQKTGRVDVATLTQWRSLLKDTATDPVKHAVALHTVERNLAAVCKDWTHALGRAWREKNRALARARAVNTEALARRDVWTACQALVFALREAWQHPEDAMRPPKGSETTLVVYMAGDVQRHVRRAGTALEDDMQDLWVFQAGVLRFLVATGEAWDRVLPALVPKVATLVHDDVVLARWVRGLPSPPDGPHAVHHVWVKVMEAALAHDPTAAACATSDLEATLEHCAKHWGVVPLGLRKEVAKRHAEVPVAAAGPPHGCQEGVEAVVSLLRDARVSGE